jgi:hypothetical protein
MEPDLIKSTEIFLIPSSFLVAALGTADTNPHRAAVSLVGLTVSALWLTCACESMPKIKPSDQAPRSRRLRILAWWLPMVFIVGWSISVVIHLLLWNAPLRNRSSAGLSTEQKRGVYITNQARVCEPREFRSTQNTGRHWRNETTNTTTMAIANSSS